MTGRWPIRCILRQVPWLLAAAWAVSFVSCCFARQFRFVDISVTTCSRRRPPRAPLFSIEKTVISSTASRSIIFQHQRARSTARSSTGDRVLLRRLRDA